jgi:hypothetical protein
MSNMQKFGVVQEGKVESEVLVTFESPGYAVAFQMLWENGLWMDVAEQVIEQILKHPTTYANWIEKETAEKLRERMSK